MDSDASHARPRNRIGSASFVIRVWREGDGIEDFDPSGGDAPGLRGSVEVVGRQTVRYFASLEHMAEIVADTLEVPAPPWTRRMP
jgi:hypothetical protein